MVDSIGLEAILNRLETGKRLSKQDLQILVTAVRSQQVTIATGDQAVAIGGSADGAVIVTGDGNQVTILGSDWGYLEAMLRSMLEGTPTKRSVPYFYPTDLGSQTFVGRNEELRELHRLLAKGDRVAIAAASGMGGLGKTELAWQYAHHHRGDYPGGIWWIPQSNRVGQMLVFGIRMQLPEAPVMLETDEQRVQWYYARWLDAIPEGKRLLVWDDVQDYGEIRGFLPQDERYRVLVTTRAKMGPPVQRLDLEVLPPALALELLRLLVGDDSRISAETNTAQALCEWVGRLPLGIELIGRHLAGRPSLQFATLLERLEAQKLKAKAVQQVPSEMGYRANLEAAFELSWQLLEPEAKQLGELLSVFALAPVAKEWVVASLPERDEEQLEEAESALFLWSLVSLEEGRYVLHTLIREFFAAKLTAELGEQAEQLKQSMTEAMIAVVKTVPKSITLSDMERVQGAIVHWMVVVEQFTALLKGRLDALKLFDVLARVAEWQHHWSEAEQHYKACMQMSKQRFGNDHPLVTKSLNGLACLYHKMGRYGEAEPLFVRSIEINERSIGMNNLVSAVPLNCLANLYRSMGRYEEAESLFVRSLEIRERELEASDPYIAESLNNLAMLYKSMGRYSEAEPLLVRSLEIREQALGAGHLQTTNNLNNLAMLYKSMGRYSEAEPLLVRSLEIYERELGKNHPDTATCLNNLALIYNLTNRHAKAEVLYVRSLKIREQELGGNHPNTAASLSNLAMLYNIMGRYVEAEPLYIRSLEIRKQKLGEGHPDTATSLGGLASLYRSMGQYSKAESLYVKLLEIQERDLGTTHPNTAASCIGLAFLYRKIGRYSEAESLYIRAISSLRQHLGEWNPNTQNGLKDFFNFVKEVVNAGKEADLSTNSMTQVMLAEVRD